MRTMFFVLLLSLGLLTACVKQEETADVKREAGKDLSTRMARYVPVDITWDDNVLSPDEREALKHLVAAAEIMDKIFLQQVSPSNPEWLASITDPTTKAYFLLNKGPWDRLDGDEPFWGKEKKLAGAGFYPPDLTREAFTAYVKAHPDQREALTSTTTIIKREGDKLVAIPYSTAYHDLLSEAADHLRKAAALTDNASLKDFLLKRADAFLSDDYRDSDMAWMDIKNSALDPTIGPYEVYEDKLFSYKASYEAFISVVEPEESKKLSKIAALLPEMEKHIPLAPELDSPPRGGESPIRVVNLVIGTGDAAAGVQTVAYNLPNDEEVRKLKGSKKVLMKNVIDAKFSGILTPIARAMVAKDQLPLVSMAAFFNNTLFHEVSHGMGPGILTLPDGRKTTVAKEIKDLYPAIEEAKADVMGVYNVLYLVDKGFLPESLRQESPVTYLAGMFRSIRFGLNEAHGRGIAFEFNYLTEKGAFKRDEAGTYRVDLKIFPEALKDLLHDILIVQAKGDYAGARHLMETYGVLKQPMGDDLNRLKTIPVDIRPIYHLPQ